MPNQEKWMPTRIAPTYHPDAQPTVAPAQAERRKKDKRRRRYIPPAFTWLKIMAWLNLSIGGLGVFQTFFGANKLSEMEHQLWLLMGLFYLMFVVTPIAVLMRTKAGFYLGLVATIPLFLGFPIGTILAAITYKAFMDSRETFGVR